MRAWIFFFFTLCSQLAIAQSFDRQVHNFGRIEKTTQRWTDFNFTNSSAEVVYVLRFDTPDDVSAKLTSQTIEPGQSIIVRLQYNPLSRGKFTRVVQVHLSNLSRPIDLKLTGVVAEIDESQFTMCPNFNTKPESKIPESSLLVTVMDASTQLPIAGAQVKYVPRKGIRPVLTNSRGQADLILPFGIYDIEGTAQGYEGADSRIYVGIGDNSVTLFLNPLEQPVAISLPQTDEAEDSEPSIEVEPEEIEITPEAKPEPTVNPGELPINEFKPNNIIFLVDISGSMDRPDRLPLMKTAMVKMLYKLRMSDKLAIITYADAARVLMNSRSADDKEGIRYYFDRLKAGGNTEGSKGLKLAYRVAESNFIAGGNNQIYLATDGNFVLEAEDKEMIAAYAAKGIYLSVIGLGDNAYHQGKLKALSQSAGGGYMLLKPGPSADEELTEFVKSQSRIQ